MARYGAGSLYNAGVYYGAQDPAATVYNSNLIAVQTDYKIVDLSWGTINVDVSGGAPTATHWKIIKSTSGAPDHPNDGIYVTGGTAPGGTLGVGAVSNGSFSDTETVFPSGTEVTYSFWVYNGLDWYFCGAVETIVVKAKSSDTTLRLLNMLPSIWTSDSSTLTETGAYVDRYKTELDSNGDPQDTDLYKFLSGFGFYYDKLSLQIDNAYKSSDYRFYPRRRLESGIRDLGFTPEPTLGDQYHRSLFRHGNVINSLKGSSLGLNIYVKSLTHFNNTVTLGTNLFLDYLTSSFEGGIGTWAATGATLASAAYNGAFAKPTLPLTDITSTYFKIKQAYYGSITTTATTATVNSYSSDHKRTDTIPVTPGTKYYFSGYVREVNATSTTIAAGIQWFDLTGTQIGSTVYNSTVNPTNAGWTKFESSTTTTNATAPSNAAYAGISFAISGTSGTIFYIDDLQFAVVPASDISFGAGYPIYEDARTVNIQLDGTRTNYLPNPGFDNGAGSWGILNGSLSIDSTNYVYGTTSGKFTANNTVGAIHSDWVTLELDTYYTFSAYVKGPATKTAKVGVEFTFPQKTVDQIKVSKDAYSSYLPAPTNVTYSDPVTINATTFTRISVTVRSPEYFADNGLPVAKAIINFPSTTSGDSYYVDAFLLEAAGLSTAVISKIESATPASDTFTVTTGSLHRLSVGNSVTISGTNSYTGTWIVASVPTTTTFTVTSSTSGTFTNGYASASIPKTYFQGTGGLAPTDPLTENFVGDADCEWETRTTTNWLSNPSIETNTSGWVAQSGTSIARNTVTYNFGASSLAVTPTASNNYQTYTSANVPSIIALSGSETVSSYLKGGESVTVSAYVYGPAGTYTIGCGISSTTSITSSLGVSGAGNAAIDSGGSFVVPLNTWTRIDTTVQLPKITSGTTLPLYLHIGSNLSSGPYYVDGAQIEFGTTPTPFVDPASASTVIVVNPKGAANMYASTRPLIGGGRSYFWTRQDNKLERLARSLYNYLPIDASFKFTKGDPTPTYLPEVDSSVFVENSFENNLNNWSVSSNAFCNRVVGLGSLYTDSDSNTFYGAYSTSWLNITRGTSSTSALSAAKSNIQVRTSVGASAQDVEAIEYYFSAAIKSAPRNATTHAARSRGTYAATINWYQTDGTTAASTASTTISGLTLTSDNENRWNLLFGKVLCPYDAKYAKITVTFTPTSASSTPGIDAFLLDRVIFKKL